MNSIRIWLKNRGFILFIFCILLQLAFSFCFSLLKLKLPAYVITFCSYLLVITSFLIFQANRVTRFNFFKNISIQTVFTSIGTGILMYLLAMSVVVMLITFLTVVFGSNLPHWFIASNDGFAFFLDSKSIFGKIFWIVLIVIIGPFIEELVFRGYLQNAINKHCNKKNIDVILVALIFAFFHYNSFANIVFAFVVGYSLSNQCKKNKSILASFIIHACVNATSLGVGCLALQFVK